MSNLFERVTKLPIEKRVILEQKLRQKRAGLSDAQNIPRRVATESFPLSFAQQRIWFFEQWHPGSPLYNITYIVDLSGKLNLEALEKSINEIIQRHEILRATFLEQNGQPVQIVVPAESQTLCLIDLSVFPKAEQDIQELNLTTEEATRPFDLTKDLLLRATLLRLDTDQHKLLVSMHHIASDGWSMGILMREMVTLYKAFTNYLPSPLSPLPLQYTDFAYWQRQRLQGSLLETQLNYWKEQLLDVSILKLPTDRPRSVIEDSSGATQTFYLSNSLTEKLRLFSQHEGVTLFMTLLATFQVLLYRYTGQTDISVGSPIANRNWAEIEDLIGFFVNTLVLRTDLSGDITFKELLTRVRETTLGAYTHQDLPFEKLVEELNPQRDLSRTPLFQVMFVLQNTPLSILDQPDLTIEAYPISNGTAKFDLTLDIVEEGTEGLRGTFEYDTKLFDNSTIERMREHFLILLENAISYSEQAISNLPLLTEHERHRLLIEWNDTKKVIPVEQCVHQLFEAQVEQTPNAIAIVCENKRLTYQELNRQANKLANALTDQGVGPEVIVGLFAERGIDFLITILAIFKAGGAYLPLDPTHPNKRIIQVLEQSQIALVLTTSEFQPLLTEMLTNTSASPQMLIVETLVNSRCWEENLPARSKPDNLAYVMYTSGSTGVPKGVMVEQIGMLNHIYAKISDLQITEVDIIAQNGPQCFDISIWQFLAALLVGGRIQVFNDHIAQDPEKLLEQVESNNITILQIVPSMLQAMTQIAEMLGNSRPAFSALRWMVPTGDALTSDLCRQWLTLYPNIPLLNTYGSTECSDDQAHYPIVESPSSDFNLPIMPIGRPIANMQMYILDQALEPVPIGIIGELFVGGVGVGRGYLNDKKRTNEVFIKNPFVQNPNARLYKTRDRVRYLPDGNIEFLGRSDHLVKIRGYRIEPGEIEAEIRKYPDIQEVIVLAREDRGKDKYLVAYILSNQESSINTDELPSFLRRKLPEYMIPSVYVILEAFPLNSNGKIDRKALPIPTSQNEERKYNYVAPGTPLEEALVEIWSRILNIEQIGIHDNFFNLGGHSLLATQVVSQIRHIFQIELPLRDLFEAPTIAGLTRKIEGYQIVQEKDEDLVKMLDEVESLSPDEVQEKVHEKTVAIQEIEKKTVQTGTASSLSNPIL